MHFQVSVNWNNALNNLVEVQWWHINGILFLILCISAQYRYNVALRLMNVLELLFIVSSC